jgi:GAF domain-containing protein
MSATSSVRRLCIVVALALVSISLWAPDLRRVFGHPIGYLFVTVDANGRFAAQSTAGVAPLTIAPYVDLRSSSIATRLRWLRNSDGCWTLDAGDRCDLYFTSPRGGAHVSRPTPAEPAADMALIVLRDLLALGWLAAGCALLLLRPSPATWSFFVLSLYGWTPNNVYTMLGPPWLQVVATTFEDIWETCIPFAGPIFALYLMQPQAMPAWRRIALRVTYAVAVLAALYEITSTYLIVVAGSSRALFLHEIISGFLIVLAILLAPAFLFATYMGSEPAQRQRIRWVLLGFTLGSVAILGTLRVTSYVSYSACLTGYVFFVTASTAYAVLRHRIVDINVVISRTIAYTFLSALLVAIFALVDLFFTRTLSESNIGLVADVAIALVIGFFMNGIHHRVDQLVDGILFRRRHLAENHVALVADALHHATSLEGVDRMLIDEPVRAFNLVFGALARCDAGGNWRVAHATEETLTGAALDDADALVASLAARHKALSLREHFWRAEHIAHGGVEASTAVPVRSNGDLVGVALFAPHTNSTLIDGDEIALLERVADSAGTAYGRLEARELRKRIARLRRHRGDRADVAAGGE